MTSLQKKGDKTAGFGKNGSTKKDTQTLDSAAELVSEKKHNSWFRTGQRKKKLIQKGTIDRLQRGDALEGPCVVSSLNKTR